MTNNCIAQNSHDDVQATIALKTNVLFDLALTPNIEVEAPFGNNSRWSVMAECWFPWFLYNRNHEGDTNPYRKPGKKAYGSSYEVWMLGGEVRYWLQTRDTDRRIPLRGAFLGLYGGGGKYDWERHSKGDQGEYWSAGLTIGYTWKLGRRFNLEASASAGYLDGPRRHYEGMFDDTHLIYQYDHRLRYIGPTKLKVSVAWLIGNTKNKRKEAAHEQ